MTETAAPARASWFDALLFSPMRVHPLAATLLIAGVVGVAWLVNYLAGGASVLAPHAFYLPIFLAGAWFGFAGALVTALAATVVAGPLLPLELDPRVAQPASDWISRGSFFVAIGVAVTAAIVRLQAALQSEREVLLLGRALAESRALIVQSVSYEVRTPLTVIKGTSQILAEHLHEPRLVELVEGLQRSAERLERLLDTVLAAAETLDRPTPAEPLWVDLGRVCEEIAQGLAPDASLRVRAEPGLARFPVDHQLLAVALRAAFQSAAGLSLPGEPVDVDVAHHPDAVEVRVVAGHTDVSADDLGSVLEPLAVSERREGGQAERLGLGFLVAKVVVERAGGRTTARPGPDGGFEITIRIPVAARPFGFRGVVST